MEKVMLLDPQEFWNKQKELLQQVLREELIENVSPKPQQEDILLLDDVCRILKKSKQTIYNWMDAGIIKGHYLNESLFFFRSEIIEVLKADKNTKNKNA